MAFLLGCSSTNNPLLAAVALHQIHWIYWYCVAVYVVVLHGFYPFHPVRRWYLFVLMPDQVVYTECVRLVVDRS